MASRRWAGIALGGDGASDAAMASRLPSYLHPLAGRPVCWHVLASLARLDPTPAASLLVTERALPPELGAALDAVALERGAAAAGSLPPDLDAVLLVSASAPTLLDELAALLEEGPGSALAVEGRTAALCLAPDDARALLSDPDAPFEPRAGAARALDPASAPLVCDRATLARAVEVVRDRLVRRHMAAGVTFLLPGSVLIDVDVTIGRDTIVYPGVVLEGSTSVGEETVIGPGCRIIDSRIGSGVELKGWNYVARTGVRNRAILEPYVRRGFE